MFSLLKESVKNVIDMGTVLVDGDLPTKGQVNKLIASGLSIASISALSGYGIDVIEDILKDTK